MKRPKKKTRCKCITMNFDEQYLLYVFIYLKNVKFRDYMLDNFVSK